MKIKVYNTTKDTLPILQKIGRLPKEIVWIQEVGAVPGKMIGDLVVGDRIVYNYGSISEVIEVEPLKGASRTYKTRDQKGNEYSITRRAKTLVAVVQ